MGSAASVSNTLTEGVSTRFSIRRKSFSIKAPKVSVRVPNLMKSFRIKGQNTKDADDEEDEPEEAFNEQAVLDSNHEAIINIVKSHRNKSQYRWQKILQQINQVKIFRHSENITKELLFEKLAMIFQSLKNMQPDKLLIDNMTSLYNKHSPERGKRVSQAERNDRGLVDESFSYGEVSFTVFANLLLRIHTIFGISPDSTFYDLGCGVGSLVYTAAMLGYFKTCVGIEYLSNLSIRGEKRKRRWNNIQNMNNNLKRVQIEFQCKDFIQESQWANNADFIFLHWTAFSTKQQQRVSDILKDSVIGTYVLSITHPVRNESFLVINQGTCETSWGCADYFLQEKVH